MMLSQPPVNDAAGDLMNIAIPKEIKKQEYRVGLLPSVAYQLVQQGHTVLVERGAGEDTGYPDADYEQAGAKLIDDHEALFAEGDLVVKVKEPLPEEYGLLRPGQVLFTYFHLAASRELTEAVCRCSSRCARSPGACRCWSAATFWPATSAEPASCSAAWRACCRAE